MEVYEFDYGWNHVRARIWESGSIYVDLPLRWGQRGATFRDSICLEDRGWRFTSTQDDCIDYIFHMWMRDDGLMSYTNDMMSRIEFLDEPFNPDYPNAGYLNDTAMKLYTISHEIREYQKRNLPTKEIFDLRKMYLTVALKALGYDSIDSIENPLDDSRGYLGLNKVVDSLEKYRDLSKLVHSLGNYGDWEQYKSRATKEATREDCLEYAKPVKEQIDELVDFMSQREATIQDKRKVYPGYKVGMKEKEGELSFEFYESKVKAVALLLLELNADLLTDEQREKFGIKPFEVMSDIAVEDKISSLIDQKDFNDACLIEDGFAYDESEELVTRLRKINPESDFEEPVLPREAVVKLYEAELKDLEERKGSVATQEKIHKKYYSKTRKRDVKLKDDEIMY